MDQSQVMMQVSLCICSPRCLIASYSIFTSSLAAIPSFFSTVECVWRPAKSDKQIWQWLHARSLLTGLGRS